MLARQVATISSRSQRIKPSSARVGTSRWGSSPGKPRATIRIQTGSTRCRRGRARERPQHLLDVDRVGAAPKLDHPANLAVGCPSVHVSTSALAGPAKATHGRRETLRSRHDLDADQIVDGTPSPETVVLAVAPRLSLVVIGVVAVFSDANVFGMAPPQIARIPSPASSAMTATRPSSSTGLGKVTRSRASSSPSIRRRRHGGRRVAL